MPADSRPRINWISPLPPARTDIGHYTARLLPALARRCAVDVWTQDHRWDRAIHDYAQRVTVIPEGSVGWPPFNAADFNVYHLGNNPLHHGRILALARRYPGIVVLHDLSLHEMVAELVRPLPEGNARYLELLRYFYGRGAAEAGRAFIRGELSIEAVAEAFPLQEYATEGALGVVTHNPAAWETLAAGSAAPVLQSPLPWFGREALPPLPSAAVSGDPRWLFTTPDRNAEPGANAGASGANTGCGRGTDAEAYVDADEAPEAARGQGTLRLIACGYFHGENRRLRPILEAIATFPRRERLRLDLYGEVGFREAFAGWLRDWRLEDQVRVHGFVSEAALGAALDAGGLALNLRFPTRGEASGSLLRLWMHGVPVLVSRTGFYATVPAGTVGWVDPRREIADLHAHFNACLDEPERYRAIGLAGRQRLESHHVAERFVDDLLAFFETVAAHRGTAFAAPFGRRLARRIARDFAPAAGAVPVPSGETGAPMTTTAAAVNPAGPADLRPGLLRRVAAELGHWV